MAEEDEKLNDTLEDVAKRLSEGNRNQVAEMSQMQREMNVMKEIAEAVLDIRQMMALSALAEKRSSSLGTQENEPEKNAPLKTAEDLKEVDTPKEMIAAIAGAIAGLVAGIAAGIAGLASSFLSRVSSMVLGEKNLATITKSWKGVLTAISEFFVGVKNFMMKPFVKLSKSMKAAEQATKSSKLGKLFGAFSKYFKMIGATLETAIAPAKMVLKEIGSMGKVFKSFFKFFKGFGKVLGRFFAPIIIAFDAIRDIFRIFSDDTTSLKDKLIDSLAAIPKAIGNFFIEIPEMIKKGLSWLFEKLVGPDNPITKFLDSFSFTEMWSNSVDSVTKFFKEFNLDSITNFFKESGEWVKDNFASAMNGIDSVWTTVKDAVSKVFDTFKGIFTGIKDFFVKAFSWFTTENEEGQTGVDTIWRGVKGIVSKVFGVFEGIFTGVKDFFVKVFSWFTSENEEGQTSADTVWTTVKDVVTKVFGAFKGIFTGIKDFFVKVSSWFTTENEEGQTGVDTIWQSVKDVVTKVFDTFKGIFSGIKNFFGGVFSWFTTEDEEGQSGVDTIWQTVKDAVTKVFDFYKGIFTGIKDTFTSVLSWFTTEKEENGDDTENEMKYILKKPYEMIKTAIDFLKNLLTWENIKGSVASLNPIPAIGSAIKNLVAGIAAAALEKFPALKYVPGFSKLAKGATETVENAISPPPAANQAVYADPSATISGLGQESVAMSDELVINKQQLDNTMSQGPLRSASNDAIHVQSDGNS